jgi:hypothetical protein
MLVKKSIMRLLAAVVFVAATFVYQSEQQPLQAQWPSCQNAWMDCQQRLGCLVTAGDNQCYQGHLIVQVACTVCGYQWWVLSSGGCDYGWCPS